eukprot:gene25167-biopygen19634
MPGRRNTPYDGKGGYDIFTTWYAELVAPLLEKSSVFSVVDVDLDYDPIDEPSNGYHYPRDSRITPVSNYLAMDHILRNCTSTLAAKRDAYTNNAAKALRYIRPNWGQGFTLSPHFYKGVNPFYDSYTTLPPPFYDYYPASTQDAALPPSTPVHQPPSSPSDDGDSTAPPTPTSDGEPSDLRAFEDAAAAADLLRGAIPMLSAWGINYEVSDPVPPEPRPENRLQEVTMASNTSHPPGSNQPAVPAQTVEAMATMNQDVPTPARPLLNWSPHPKTLEMTPEMATSPKPDFQMNP